MLAGNWESRSLPREHQSDLHNVLIGSTHKNGGTVPCSTILIQERMIVEFSSHAGPVC